MHTLWCLPFLTIALPWLRAINTPYCSWTSFSESCCAHGHGARRISQTFGERQPGCLGWSQSPCCTSIIELHACCCCTKRSKAQVIHEGFSWTVGPRGQGTSERTTTTTTTNIIQQRDMTKECELASSCSSFHPICIVIWRSQWISWGNRISSFTCWETDQHSLHPQPKLVLRKHPSTTHKLRLEYYARPKMNAWLDALRTSFPE